MSIFENVLAWADRLPPWRQDALRRLCVQGEWSNTDLDEILDLAKQHQGIKSTLASAPQPIPFAREYFPAEATQDANVVLTSLHTLVNIGKIPNDQTLDFQSHGLTIVYGGNGAGKSGYARVLKQACRARIPGTVYANAYDPNFGKLIPSATIDFELNGTPQQVLWSGQSDQASRSELRGISVFDSDCARHYLQAREAATFQPVALNYLQQLANGLSQALRPRLEAEIAGLAVDITPFNVIPADTGAGRSVHPVSATTDIAHARAYATLTADEQNELARLPQEINEADPTSKATLLDNAATKVDELADAISTAVGIVSDEAISTLQHAHQKLLDAEAAERAASALLQDEDTTRLLPGTGQGHWALLFDAARKYSTGGAYPGKAFPVIDEDAQCVLCQQELSPETKDRMLRFNQYIQDTASEAAQAARHVWQKHLREVGQTSVTFTVSQVMSDSLAKRIDTLPEDIRILQENLLSRLHWLRTSMASGNWQGKPTYHGANPIAAIRAIGNSLRTEASTLRANLDESALAAKRLHLKELNSRLLLSEHIDSIAKVVDNLSHKARLQECLRNICETRPITLFAGQLAKTYISEAQASRMNNELRKLDLYHIQAEVSSTGNSGSVNLGIKLSSSQLDPHLVLSEAEQRMCAMAYFFAELNESGSSSGIVFDDPVSSLDHNHRTAVARRIVEESADRQVIVFTHDAVFFGELTTLCNDAAQEPCVKSISYRANGPGYIDAGLPYDLRRHKERIKQHRIDHERIAASFNNPPGDKERIEVRNAYDDLRVTIEVGIEDTILNETVVRFRDNISVGRLNGVMIVQNEEYSEVQRLHDKCCRNVRAHSHAAGQQRAVTQPDELLQDLEAVNALFNAIRKRRG